MDSAGHYCATQSIYTVHGQNVNEKTVILDSFACPSPIILWIAPRVGDKKRVSVSPWLIEQLAIHFKIYQFFRSEIAARRYLFVGSPEYWPGGFSWGAYGGFSRECVAIRGAAQADGGFWGAIQFSAKWTAGIVARTTADTGGLLVSLGHGGDLILGNYFMN